MIIAAPVIGSAIPIGNTTRLLIARETRVAKFACCGSAPPIAPMIGEAECRPEGDDRAEHVQEQETVTTTPWGVPPATIPLATAPSRRPAPR